jgi:hypothetical protein
MGIKWNSLFPTSFAGNLKILDQELNQKLPQDCICIGVILLILFSFSFSLVFSQKQEFKEEFKRSNGQDRLIDFDNAV